MSETLNANSSAALSLPVAAASLPTAPVASAASGSKSPKIHLDFLDGIRGFAAFYVVIHHFLGGGVVNGLPGWMSKIVGLTAFGHTMVAVFIVLSGFSLMLPVALSDDQNLRGGFREYIRRRGLRILPAYYAAVLLSLAGLLLTPAGIAFVSGSSHDLPARTAFLANFDPLNIVAHGLLVHNVNPIWHASINSALWSVATEWQIYFLFPLILLPVWKRFGSLAVFVVGFALGLLPMLTSLRSIQWACFWYVGLFATGQIAAAFAVKRFLRAESDPAVLSHGSRRNFSGLLLLIFALSVVVYAVLLRVLPPHTIDLDIPFYLSYTTQSAKDTVVGIMVACFLVYCVQYSAAARRDATRRPLVQQFFESRLMGFLGSISYSLYLTHCIVLGLFPALEQMLSPTPMGIFLLRMLIAVPICLVFAYVFHLAFERPYLVKRASTPQLSRA